MLTLYYPKGTNQISVIYNNGENVLCSAVVNADDEHGGYRVSFSIQGENVMSYNVSTMDDGLWFAKQWCLGCLLAVQDNVSKVMRELLVQDFNQSERNLLRKAMEEIQ